MALQRLFSSFPDGAAGVGLILLRATVGGSLLAEGAKALGRGLDPSWAGALAGVLVLDGVALVIGAISPVAAAVAATVLLSRVLAPGVEGSASALVMAIAVGLLGPGAYSLDARLFGRREIEVPR